MLPLLFRNRSAIQGFRVQGWGWWFTSNLDRWRIGSDGRVHANGTVRRSWGMAAGPRSDLQGFWPHKEGQVSERKVTLNGKPW